MSQITTNTNTTTTTTSPTNTVKTNNNVNTNSLPPMQAFTYYGPAYQNYYQYYYAQMYPQYFGPTPLTPLQAQSLNVPTQSGVPIRSLYVGNLHEKVTDTLLYEIFSIIAPVESCKICKDKMTGQSVGYGFVDYFDPRAAALALAQFNGKYIYGLEIKVNWAFNATQKEDTSNHYHIFVGDLSPEIDDKALFQAFSVFGSISDARVMMDPIRPDHSRGYGFVAFRKKEDAQRALTEMNGECLGNRPIRCNWANQKGEKIEEVSNGLDYATVVTQTSLSNTTVYVGNISTDTTEHMVQSVFGEYGKIESIKMQTDKGCAFVTYTTHESAARAICAMHGRAVGTRTVKCSWGKERPAINIPPAIQPPSFR